MSWEDIRLWGLYVIFGLQLLLQLGQLISRRHLATQGQLGTLEEKIRIERGRIHETNARVVLLEQKLGQMPDHEDIAALRDDISRLTSVATGLTTKVDGLDRNIESLGGAITRTEENVFKIATERRSTAGD